MPQRSRLSRERRKDVERAAARLRDAIAREPLLRRLPGVGELAELLHAPLRVVRYALAQLTEEGWIKPTRAGHHVLHQAGQLTNRLQEVVFNYELVHAGGLFVEAVRSAISHRCAELRLAFHTRGLSSGSIDDQLDRFVQETPGRHVGWVVAVPPGAELLRRWRIDRRPVAGIGYVHPAVAMPCSVLDLPGAAALALKHLRGLGHRAIVAMSVSRRYNAPMWEAAGVPPDKISTAVPGDVPHGPARSGTISRSSLKWAENWKQEALESTAPTAIVCHDYPAALLVLDACRYTGIRVPRDLSIVAVGASHPRLEECSPQITHASSGSIHELGATAVDLLNPEGQADGSVVVQPPVLLDPELTAASPPRH